MLCTNIFIDTFLFLLLKLIIKHLKLIFVLSVVSLIESEYEDGFTYFKNFWEERRTPRPTSVHMLKLVVTMTASVV
jgi:hypothetical protein